MNELAKVFWGLIIWMCSITFICTIYDICNVPVAPLPIISIFAFAIIVTMFYMKNLK